MLLIPVLAALVLAPAQGKLIKKDVVVGKGPACKAGDLLTVDYTGTLTNGKQCDSSKGKYPMSFVLGKGEVIKGWDQGLAGMRVGGKRNLRIPPAFAYGNQALEGIPANSTLIFEVKLLHVRKKGAPVKLEFKELRAGKGRVSKVGDVVDVHYTGMFLNGHKFDSSHDRNQTMEVTLGGGGVIPGFDQGLQGMKAGQKRRVTIPPELGYGANGAGGVIPPNATLVFELELVRIKR